MCSLDGESRSHATNLDAHPFPSNRYSFRSHSPIAALPGRQRPGGQTSVNREDVSRFDRGVVQRQWTPLWPSPSKTFRKVSIPRNHSAQRLLIRYGGQFESEERANRQTLVLYSPAGSLW